MLYVLLLILLLIFVNIIPFIQMVKSNICLKEEKEYKFPRELFNRDLHEPYLQDLEGRKAKAYSIELP